MKFVTIAAGIFFGLGVANAQQPAIVDGAAHLQQPADFQVIVAPSTQLTGPLLKLTAGSAVDVHPAPGSVVLLTNISANHSGISLARRLLQLGARAVLFPANPESAQKYANAASGTSTRKHQSLPPLPPDAWVAALQPGAVARLALEPDGSPVTLSIAPAQ